MRRRCAPLHPVSMRYRQQSQGIIHRSMIAISVASRAALSRRLSFRSRSRAAPRRRSLRARTPVFREAHVFASPPADLPPANPTLQSRILFFSKNKPPRVCLEKFQFQRTPQVRLAPLIQARRWRVHQRVSAHRERGRINVSGYYTSFGNLRNNEFVCAVRGNGGDD